MNSTASLTGSHLRTYQSIFHHPVPHNLACCDVIALLEWLGSVTKEPNGNLKVTRNGQSLVLQPPHTNAVAEKDEIMALRQFLIRSDAASPEIKQEGTHWLLVIEHHEARIYRLDMAGASLRRISPHEPDDYFRPAHNSQDFSRGQEKPGSNSYFEPVAMALQGAGQILLFGCGTGMSSEMVQFMAWVKQHHPAVARRIVYSLVVDESHLTEGQLLERAREFFVTPRILTR